MRRLVVQDIALERVAEFDNLPRAIGGTDSSVAHDVA